ncbi:MAG: OmpW family protein [Betaproteobacteria bacterium]|nr:OmpW family protein [Betaproteobacteria bacterium]MBK7654403.1 OmpW family protein [Betaproteobacteria bacterium]MBP6644821.1 OmpW family protein [Burkholderiaceae bacterium]
MKKLALAALIASSLVSTASIAQDFKAGDVLVRARAVALRSANTDNTGLGLTINNKTIPELDISYFVTPNIAAELILTIPQRQTVYLKGADIGTFTHLPPTLLAQYHFNAGSFKPYVGAGLNFTHISNVSLAGGAADLKKNSWGPALQVGVDIPVAKNLYLNFDLKKVYIKTDVTLSGKDMGSFKVDPVLVGVGLGYRF